MSRPAAAAVYLDGYNRGKAGLTLRELRQRCELSLRDVERETGYNRAILSLIERGIQVPNPAHLLALSDLYGVPPEAWRLHVEFRIPEEAAV